MRYYKERGCCLRSDSLAADWGECVRYVEIGDDRYAFRQVEVYDKSRVLRYDRSHWCDRYTRLVGRLFSGKQKATAGWRREVIEPKEFERAWRKALGSAMWAQQVEQSLAAERGIVPDFLQYAQDP